MVDCDSYVFDCTAEMILGDQECFFTPKYIVVIG
jgi:hypothetical protein